MAACYWQDPQANYVRPKIQDNGDGTYVVTYTPADIGTYTVGVKFGGQSVPSAPFHVTTSPTGDASKVRILGEYKRWQSNFDIADLLQ